MPKRYYKNKAKQRRQVRSLSDKKTKKLKIKCYLIGLLIISLIISISYFSYHPSVLLKDLNLNHEDKIIYSDKEKIVEEVKKSLEGKYLFVVFPKNNIFLVSKKKIKKTIEENFATVDKVEIKKTGLNSIEINILEHKSFARWCDYPIIQIGNEILKKESYVLNISEYQSVVIPGEDDATSFVPQEITEDIRCYLLNKDGLIFYRDEDSFRNKDDKITFYGPIRKFDNKEEILIDVKEDEALFNYYGKDNYVENLNLLVNEFNNSNFDYEIKEVWYKGEEVYTLFTNSGSKIHIDINDSVESIFSNFSTVVSQTEEIEKDLSNLDYIDTRFGHRVFYRLKTGQSDSTDSAENIDINL